MDDLGQKPEGSLPFVLSLPADGVEYHEILKPPQSVAMRSGLVVLDCGEEVGSHSTRANEELLVVLDGIGEVEIEGENVQKIQKGCVAYIPPATVHNVFNVGTEPLRYLYIVSCVK